MQAALDRFQENVNRARSFGGLYAALEMQTSRVLDVTDLLRAEIVLAVSGFDHYIHEIVLRGMEHIQVGTRPETASYLRFSVSLAAVKSSAGNGDWLAAEVRRHHGHLSFQMPDKVADAIRLISDVKLWEEVGKRFGTDAKDVKDRLSLIVDRRNKIAHEADLDPTVPGIRWPITKPTADQAVDFVKRLGEVIFKVV